MSEMRCPWCDKPRATHEDWDQYGGGEGAHLCWADPRCEMDGDENVVLSLRASNAALREALQNIVEETTDETALTIARTALDAALRGEVKP